MKLNYRRTLAAALLAGIAFSAAARAAEPSLPPEADRYAASAEACPAGTFPSSPSYVYKDGHVVRDGWLCESLIKQH